MSNLVLIGFMGTGKTSVGKELSNMLQMQFYDIDSLVEEKAKMSIDCIFSLYGEAKFRELEKETLKEIASLDRVVISTGGGIVINKENVDIIRKSSFVAFLEASPEVIYRNVKEDDKRPLLRAENPMGKILELLEKRKGLYDFFDIKVDVSDLTVDQVALRIKAGFIKERRRV